LARKKANNFLEILEELSRKKKIGDCRRKEPHLSNRFMILVNSSREESYAGSRRSTRGHWGGLM
jgi:hypothetical protein